MFHVVKSPASVSGDEAYLVCISRGLDVLRKVFAFIPPFKLLLSVYRKLWPRKEADYSFMK
jgi:hypothetical protein